MNRSDRESNDVAILYSGSRAGIGRAAVRIDDGQLIHASSSDGEAVIASLSATYHDIRYYGTRWVVS